jgi:peroxiredoxin Q/BCP
MAIVVNKPLPEFEANATGGIKVTNTTEAMQFRDKYKDFVKAGATVFGVSRDNMKSHDDFKEKLELPFELIADTEEKMCHMFGVVKNKIMYGKKVKGIERSTFLVGADGLLVQEWRGLKVPGHVDEVLKAVKTLKALKQAA